MQSINSLSSGTLTVSIEQAARKLCESVVGTNPMVAKAIDLRAIFGTLAAFASYL